MSCEKVITLLYLVMSGTIFSFYKYNQTFPAVGDQTFLLLCINLGPFSIANFVSSNTNCICHVLNGLPQYFYEF